MDRKSTYIRPAFTDALVAWRQLLALRGLPADLIWIFDENICFESDPSQPNGFRLGFQTAFTPPPLDAERIAYEYFAEFDAPVVFYRIGSATGKSVCLVLCDSWFESRMDAAGFVPKREWLMSFFPGQATEIPEVTDKERWKNRIVRERPLHDLDFCMTLRSVHEWLAHGRVLSTYERSALKVLHLWRRVMGREKD
ncbi:MAG: hypothetical protein C5B50_24155 [Verrucomicrobia bacterium]|nr:MAG: hypothetical protein C5B50_24155 [Verrucomicrobiota bacterium]